MQNKYTAKKSLCSQGHKHDSRWEAKYCNDLELLKRGGAIKGYDVQVPFDLKVNDALICVHRVDFVVYNQEGNKEVHEPKGFESSDWKIKKKLFEALYPEIPYFVIIDEKAKERWNRWKKRKKEEKGRSKGRVWVTR